MKTGPSPLSRALASQERLRPRAVAASAGVSRRSKGARVGCLVIFISRHEWVRSCPGDRKRSDWKSALRLKRRFDFLQERRPGADHLSALDSLIAHVQARS